MIRTLTYGLALGAVALCCNSAIAAVPAAGASSATPAATNASPGPLIAGLQAKIVTVNPRLAHHKGRQLRVFVRNLGPSASPRGSIRLRTRPTQQPAFVTEARPLPAIAPGGEVSRTFNLPRHLRALPPLSHLEAVVTLPGEEMVLPAFTSNHAAPRPALPVFPSPAAPAPLK